MTWPEPISSRKLVNCGDNVRGRGSRAVKQAAMGIDWMTDVELNEAIPPVYTQVLGLQLATALEHAA